MPCCAQCYRPFPTPSVLAIELCRSATPALLPQVAMVLAHLAATQPALAVLPDRAFKHLAKLPALAQALAGLAERGMDAGRLRALVARAVAARVGAHANYARLAMELASCVRLGGDEAEALARAVLYAASAECDGEAGAGDVRDVLLKAASTLDARYPEAVGAAVNAALRDAGSEGPSAGQRARLLRFLDDAFARSLRAPLAGAGTTLALALDAASAGTRQMVSTGGVLFSSSCVDSCSFFAGAKVSKQAQLMPPFMQALERLDAAAAEAAAMGDDEGMALLHAAALRRLADDSPDVAMATLQLRSLIQAPAILLGDALERCFLSALGKVGPGHQC